MGIIKGLKKSAGKARALRDEKNEEYIQLFEVSKAFPIEVEENRCINADCAAFFQGEAAKYRDKKGCYIFSLRTGNGILPYYVGMTLRSFAEEAFSDQKISKHYRHIVAKNNGTPLMTFVALVPTRGRPPETVIRILESELIKMAYYRNSRLTNRKGIPKERWAIKGVIRNDQGAPTKEERAFKKLMGL
ncbi:MAG: hypothetical protein IJR99_01145 [Kiritimatiellae bacterium]|nr:hypothetical protein [Kiritimatiellia bacterium]